MPIEAVVIDEHCLNASEPIDNTELGIVIADNEEQPKKADGPIDNTESGIIMEDNDEQPLNANAPI